MPTTNFFTHLQSSNFFSDHQMSVTLNANCWVNMVNSNHLQYIVPAIHKTISTRAHIDGDNLPVLICIISCVDDYQRYFQKHKKLAILRGFSISK